MEAVAGIWCCRAGAVSYPLLVLLAMLACIAPEGAAQYACRAGHVFSHGTCMTQLHGILVQDIGSAWTQCALPPTRQHVVVSTPVLLPSLKAFVDPGHLVYTNAYGLQQGWTWIWPNGTVVAVFPPGQGPPVVYGHALALNVTSGELQAVPVGVPAGTDSGPGAQLYGVVCQAAANVPCPVGFRYTVYPPMGVNKCTVVGGLHGVLGTLIGGVPVVLPLTWAAANATCTALNSTLMTTPYFPKAFEGLGPEVPGMVWTARGAMVSSAAGAVGAPGTLVPSTPPLMALPYVCEYHVYFRTPAGGAGRLFLANGTAVCGHSNIGTAVVACNMLGFKNNYDGVFSLVPYHGPGVVIATTCTGFEQHYRLCKRPVYVTWVRACVSQVVLNCTRGV